MLAGATQPGSIRATYATLTGRGNVRGVVAPRTGCCQPMTANDDTPRSGDSADGSTDWEQLGRGLLRRDLERHADELREAFVEASTEAAAGTIDAETAHSLRHVLMQAGYLVEDLEDATIPERKE